MDGKCVQCGGDLSIYDLSADVDNHSNRWECIHNLQATVKEQRALIAAAPDLLAACEAMLAEAHLQDAFQDEDGDAILERARAAIAKARGEGGKE